MMEEQKLLLSFIISNSNAHSPTIITSKLLELKITPLLHSFLCFFFNLWLKNKNYSIILCFLLSSNPGTTVSLTVFVAFCRNTIIMILSLYLTAIIFNSSSRCAVPEWMMLTLYIIFVSYFLLDFVVHFFLFSYFFSRLDE